MTSRLAVVLEGVRTGTIELGTSGRLSLTYDPAAGADGRTPLSVSMPPEVTSWSGRLVRSWLSNLLPDNERVLQRWATRFQVSPSSPFKLLTHVGRDVAGAVQLVPEDQLAGIDQGGLIPLSDKELRTRLAELRADPAAWTDERAAGLFSLSGAQPKIALRRVGRQWSLPWGAEPTTHILKPYGSDLPHQALNEHLSLGLAYEVGLAAARSEILRVGGASVVAVERFDRVGADPVRRVHQEDMCQALGLAPGRKYQADGGPGIVEIVELLRRVKGPARSRADVERFLQAQAFAWATAATDAHAKNYGLLLSGTDVVLAPLYDLQSAAPYLTGERRAVPPGQVSVHTARLAMRIGSQARFDLVSGSDWRALAQRLRLPEEDVLALVTDVLQRIPDALERLTHGTDGPPFTPAELEFTKVYRSSVLRRSRGALASLRGRGPQRRIRDS